jgi:valyl-tRNA synthetase
MDIIVRWHRMRGFQTLWLPGTDHAGIATQMMVERQLASEGKDRRSLGREAFVERVWEWKRHYGGAILDQMKRLGASVDWEREYFTMDERLSRAVREAFVRLHEEGLIYRGKYIVNWCPRCMTAISDLEVVHQEFAGKLYQIKYPVVGSKDDFVVVATTRPETMLGDVAVAVNPYDERYGRVHGKKVRLPLMDRELPVILDELAKPEFGTGAVKVTPAHDANDFQAGLRHNLEPIVVMDERAQIINTNPRYDGLDRFKAREKVLEDLKAQGLLVGVKDHTYALGHCDRCKTVVEPRLSTQWFVKIAPLAKRAIEVVEKGEIRFTPENYKTIYLNWMYNIHDWCISRQLWWGHRIPAWHCQEKGCQHITVAREAPQRCSKCEGAQLEQDPDVLDTWFSSGLLPFTTLGWPEKTRDQAFFYPGTLLITAYEILFFWVARMIMFGCHFMHAHRQDSEVRQASGWAERSDDSVPFREVYIHALVRDAEGQKMAKTKGNVLDPIEVIEKYGTDAVRFTLAAMASPGTDIAFSESRTEGYRAFANKIWNAARFLLMNLELAGGHEAITRWFQSRGEDGRDLETRLEDRWIQSRLQRVTHEVNASLRAYRFDEAAKAVYDFFWREFCDWYIEMLKPRLGPGQSEAEKFSRYSALMHLLLVFQQGLLLLAPFMPFLTEELWYALHDGKPARKSIALAPFPEAKPALIDAQVEEEMGILQELIQSVRNIRAEMKIEPRARVPIQVFAEKDVRQLIEENRSTVERLAHVEGIEFVGASLAKMAGARASAHFEVVVTFEQKVDPVAERQRLQKELKRMETEMANAQRQLSNEQFLAKAPGQVVEGIRKRASELEVLMKKMRVALKELG